MQKLVKFLESAETAGARIACRPCRLSLPLTTRPFKRAGVGYDHNYSRPLLVEMDFPSQLSLAHFRLDLRRLARQAFSTGSVSSVHSEAGLTFHIRTPSASAPKVLNAVVLYDRRTQAGAVRALVDRWPANR